MGGLGMFLFWLAPRLTLSSLQAFYLVIPLCGIIVVAGLILFPSYRVPSNKSAWENLKSLAVVGCALHLGPVVLLAIACIFSGPTWDWNSAKTGAVWVLLGAVFIAYVVQQRYCLFTSPENRIFPVDVFKNRAVALSFVGTVCSAVGYGATLYVSLPPRPPGSAPGSRLTLPAPGPSTRPSGLRSRAAPTR